MIRTEMSTPRNQSIMATHVGDILVGTASWADKSLLDSRLFYPKEAKTAEARLWYYSTQFPLVEVDSSYYAMPAPHVAEL